MSAVDFWRGEFGDAYTDRNRVTDGRMAALVNLWADILPSLSPRPQSILEIGANVGANLKALSLMCDATLYAVEPNELARARLSKIAAARDGTAADPGEPGADLVFTSGVLIHIPPADLAAAMAGIYRAAAKHIVCIEYFSDQPQEVVYRGHEGRLWKRDFGALWLDAYPDLTPVGCGFCWKRLTGLDNLTWWAFSK